MAEYQYEGLEDPFEAEVAIIHDRMSSLDARLYDQQKEIMDIKDEAKKELTEFIERAKKDIQETVRDEVNKQFAAWKSR